MLVDKYMKSFYLSRHLSSGGISHFNIENYQQAVVSSKYYIGHCAALPVSPVQLLSAREDFAGEQAETVQCPEAEDTPGHSWTLLDTPGHSWTLLMSPGHY